MRKALIIALCMLSGCKMYAGLEAQASGKYEGKEWEHDNPVGIVGAEINQFITDNFGVRAYVEHRSVPFYDDGYGQNLIGGKLLWRIE